MSLVLLDPDAGRPEVLGLKIGALCLVPSKFFVPELKNMFLVKDSDGSVEGTFLLGAFEGLQVGVR